ncbi:hypothetical protein NDK47_00605 [Brevibacillus ruminantium]|uniref:Uncharacterized protein n=1 Tax=Brevibacillus ruminantium TaxID=2950604 RepID=A0ABY4WFH6_9BACL|nr:hypothetical protein [Brevibacillus ruminantium]USG65892.1 hypothetical protein NDK47_00605 [Brevibacillus ruminantium]
MKRKNIKLIYPFLLVVGLFVIYGETARQDDLFSSETEYPIVSGRPFLAVAYSSIDEMYRDADVVAEIEIIDQEVEMLDGTIAQTISEAKIQALYKGDPELETIVIAEVGGPVDYTKISIDKPSTGRHKPEIVEQTVEGSPVMKVNNSYMVFLRHNQKSDTYSPMGSVQGKLKLQNDRVVFTVKKDALEEDDDLFFLQKEFGGKNSKKLVDKIISLKEEE